MSDYLQKVEPTLSNIMCIKSSLSCSWAQQLLQDVLEDAGFLCNVTTMFMDVIWRISCTLDSEQIQYYCKVILLIAGVPIKYEVCSKKDRTFAIKTLLLILQILSTVPLRVVPSTCNTPFPTFLPFLECLLERTCCDGAQFNCRIFLNLLCGLETTSFQSGFKLGKQEKVCWG